MNTLANKLSALVYNFIILLKYREPEQFAHIYDQQNMLILLKYFFLLEVNSSLKIGFNNYR